MNYTTQTGSYRTHKHYGNCEDGCFTVTATHSHHHTPPNGETGEETPLGPALSGLAASVRACDWNRRPWKPSTRYTQTCRPDANDATSRRAETTGGCLSQTVGRPDTLTHPPCCCRRRPVEKWRNRAAGSALLPTHTHTYARRPRIYAWHTHTHTRARRGGLSKWRLRQSHLSGRRTRPAESSRRLRRRLECARRFTIALLYCCVCRVAISVALCARMRACRRRCVCVCFTLYTYFIHAVTVIPRGFDSARARDTRNRMVIYHRTRLQGGFKNVM